MGLKVGVGKLAIYDICTCAYTNATKARHVRIRMTFGIWSTERVTYWPRNWGRFSPNEIAKTRENYRSWIRAATTASSSQCWPATWCGPTPGSPALTTTGSSTTGATAKSSETETGIWFARKETEIVWPTIRLPTNSFPCHVKARTTLNIAEFAIEVRPAMIHFVRN